VLVTLAVLRLQIPHAALAVMYGVHRSTVTRAVRQVRPLLAGRGYATPAGPRLHTLRVTWHARESAFTQWLDRQASIGNQIRLATWMYRSGDWTVRSSGGLPWPHAG
jgi:hypothetical protein